MEGDARRTGELGPEGSGGGSTGGREAKRAWLAAAAAEQALAEVPWLHWERYHRLAAKVIAGSRTEERSSPAAARRQDSVSGDRSVVHARVGR